MHSKWSASKGHLKFLAGEYAVSHGLNGKCGCDECLQRMLEMDNDDIDEDEDEDEDEDKDEDPSGTLWCPYSSLQA